MIKTEIKRLDKLKNTLLEAQRAAQAIDGEIAELRFNPADPQSIKRAIAEGKAKVDEKLGCYSSNPIAKQMAVALKQKIEESVRERAKAALKSND